jgi:hypothetical protein
VADKNILNTKDTKYTTVISLFFLLSYLCDRLSRGVLPQDCV